MDKDFKTTFIPKNSPIIKTATPSAGSGRTQGFIGILAILLLITTVVSVVGVFIWKLRLSTDLNSQIESINRAEKAFEPSTIIELKKLDIRLNAATELLSQHVAVVDFFESLGETTLPDIQYSGISIDFSESVPEVDTTGVARGYLPIAQQSDLFESNRYIQNPIFSDFSKNEAGQITFSLSFSLNPELLLYGRTLQELDTADSEENEDVNFDNIIIEDQSSALPGGTNVDFNN